VFPCIISPAAPTVPPYVWPMHWCPRQTPRVGISEPNVAIMSFDIPALSGVRGPGEM
ncbi:uncharacterized protein METZ01_LOCUS289601, partial [marine metagenome]